jgi:membrane-associated phospholipid phosphatase
MSEEDRYQGRDQEREHDRNAAAELHVRAQIALLWRKHGRALVILGLAAGLALTLAVTPPDTLGRMAARLIARRSLVVMLALLGLLGLSLLWTSGQELDAWVFLRINLGGRHPPLLDRAMWLATQLGNLVTALTLAGIALLTRNWHLATEIVLGGITVWLIVESIKAVAARTRPYGVFAETRVIGPQPLGSSFPSGHTSQAFFLASLLAHHFQLSTGLAFLLYGLATLVGFTRMYVGAHYPRDVLGGLIVGWVWGVVGALVDQSWVRG